jgi:hypothetical protein
LDTELMLAGLLHLVCLENGAVSMGRCNTGLEFTSGSFKA